MMMQVLIVENDSDVASILKDIVEIDQAHTVTGIAIDLDGAVASMDACPPQLALIDLHLAGNSCADRSMTFGQGFSLANCIGRRGARTTHSAQFLLASPPRLNEKLGREFKTSHERQASDYKLQVRPAEQLLCASARGQPEGICHGRLYSQRSRSHPLSHQDRRSACRGTAVRPRPRRPRPAPPGLIPTYNLSWGLRTVDGSYNALLPGREYWGASNQPFETHVDPVYRTFPLNLNGRRAGRGGHANYAPTLIDPDGPGPAGPANP